jgi:hypothetical protein
MQAFARRQLKGTIMIPMKKNAKNLRGVAAVG